MGEVAVYRTSLKVSPGDAPDLGKVQRAARILGLEVKEVHYDDSGDMTDASWAPTWTFYLEATDFHPVERS